MPAELFRSLRLTGLTAAATVALCSPAGAWAATNTPAKTTTSKTATAKPVTTKAKPSSGAKTPTKAKAKPKAKPKVAEAPPPPPPLLSEPASRVQGWITAERDNGSLPYIIVDKQAATLFLYKADGTFVGEAPVLIGLGVGDDSSPGVGAKDLSEIGPAERTTPAGRFVSKFGRAFGRTRVLWIDYANSVALHAVITTNKKERRLERLLSPEPDDNRVSFGCINVGTSFYNKQVRRLLEKKGGVVYILPDTKTVEDVFPRVRLLPYLSAQASQPALR